MLGSEGACSDSAPIGGVVHFGKRQLSPRRQMRSCHGAVMITLDLPEFTAGREQGQVEHDFLRLWGLVVREQPSFVATMALNFFFWFCSSPRQPDVHTCLQSTSVTVEISTIWLALLSSRPDSFRTVALLQRQFPSTTSRRGP